MDTNFKIGVLMGGISSEREISLSTGSAVLKAVKKLGYNASSIHYNDKIENNLQQLKSVDIVFIALHGGDGENGEIQAYLDSFNIIYTGSDSKASAVCMDKDRSKISVNKAGLSTPKWIVINKMDEFGDLKNTGFPVIVKPNDQGSTVGLTIAHNDKELFNGVQDALTFGSPVLVEAYIAGREVTVTVLNGEAYPIVEIIPSHELYDYECKYSAGMSQYVCPAQISDELEARLKDESVKIYNLLNCRDYSRVDFRIDGQGNPWFLEVNTLPGMTATSLVPKSLKSAGFSFEELINSIILQAKDRCQPVG